MVNSGFPKYYFKFLSFGEHSVDTIVKLLDNQIYTSEIIQLNDPFEGLWYDNHLEAPYPEEDQELRVSLERRRVYCLCSNDSEKFPLTPESIPMWSHYADSHEGFCVMFNNKILSTEDQDKACSPNKIEYSDSMAEKTGINNQDKLILFKKSNVWKGEREVRLCFREKDVKGTIHIYRELPKECIEAIFAGCRISKLNELILIGLCKKLKCSYVRLKMSSKDFRLDVISDK